MSELHAHCDRQEWKAALALFAQPTPPTIEQLLYKDEARQTALQLACLNGTPLELISTTLEQAGEFLIELCMTKDLLSRGPVGAAACGHDDPAVHLALISAFPLTLVVYNSYTSAEDAADDAEAPSLAHELAFATRRPAAVVSVLAGAFAAVIDGDYDALATLVGGDAQ